MCMWCELSSTGNYGQRLWDGREDDGVKELKKNDRWLDHRKTGSGDWAWNEKKQGLDHAWHCKLWQETGAMGKLWRALSMIKNASLPPSLIHITHKINEKNICVQKPLGTMLYFRHHPIKTGSYSYSGFCAQPWQNNSQRDFFFFINETFIYCCDLSITEFLYATENINVYDHPADIKKVRNSQLDP